MKQFILILLFLLGVAAENLFAQPKVGEPAPKIQFSTAFGKPQAADFTKGKYVVLEFWATWCGPCIAGFPQFNSLIKQFASDSVLFVAMTDETNALRIKDFLATRAKLDAINLLDDNRKTWKAFNITSIPVKVVIGKNGNVLWTGVGVDLTPEKLGNLLKGKDLPTANPAAVPASPAVAVATPKEEVQKKISVFSFSVTKVFTAPENWEIRYGINAGQRTCSATYTSLVSSLSQVYQMPSSRILLSKELVDYPKLDLVFTVDTALERKNPNMMPELLLKTLNLSAKVVTTDTMVWQMEVTDRKLLNKYKSVQYGHGGSNYESETQIILVNNSFQNISERLEDYFKTVVVALPDTVSTISGEGVIGYDLIIPKPKSFEELNTWLKKNIGIHFVKQSQKVKFVQATAGEGQSVTSGR